MTHSNCCKTRAQFNYGRKIGSIIRKGYYPRKGDSKQLPRYQCKVCHRTLSAATFSKYCHDKIRGIDKKIHEFLILSAGQNQIARLMGHDRRTIVRRFIRIHEQSKTAFESLKKAVIQQNKFETIQIDEAKTFEKSQLTPLSIAVACSKSRFVLDFELSRFPPDDPKLRTAAEKIFGEIKDSRPEKFELLLTKVKPYVSANLTIQTDKCYFYFEPIKKVFPKGIHVSSWAQESKPNTFDELKKGFDPLFSINHTLAMARYSTNRLARKTWCTTKREDRLKMHLMIGFEYHNRCVLNFLKKKGRDLE